MDHLAGILMESWVVALISALGGSLAAIIGYSIWFGRNVITREDLQQVRDVIDTERREFLEAIESLRRETGEGIASARQKATDVELEVAKHYVRRESWHQQMNQLQDSIGKAEAADLQWKLRIEEKFDRLSERIAPVPRARS